MTSPDSADPAPIATGVGSGSGEPTDADASAGGPAGAAVGGSAQPARPRTAARGARKPQSMKPATAAAKLGVHLPATPEEFRAGPITREQLEALQRTPPPWLVDLRRQGPHPRSVVAARLRVSTSGLARAGLTEPLTTAEIEGLIADPPEWLHRERASLAEVKREEARLKERDALRRSGPGAPA